MKRRKSKVKEKGVEQEGEGRREKGGKRGKEIVNKHIQFFSVIFLQNGDIIQNFHTKYELT